ncbi:hypothetical protein CFC21_039777 [Triticum aestivum]|uniref:Homeobox domain-containing protein n=3 Tax=Triticum TaxID=4564 RepID=A0A9R1RXR7_TRITD|nr:WUSCHEL-related homeobox 10-like [Triticum aestivum]KAF7027765.1 hypothetical protein CFC21_039777 [Triticum aestivum]VAH72470.1 unnamed protein product [Triticum turgidum subsp. durum]
MDQHNHGQAPAHRGGRSSEGGEPTTTRSRWAPKPEQILILESIFNSGMVNPAKDETARIRLLLERFGAVRDANVFYWFQNRRSRSRRRARQLQQSCGGTGDADQLSSNAAAAGHGCHGIGTSPYNTMQYGQLCGGVSAAAAAVTGPPRFSVDDADSGDDLFAIPRQMGLMSRGGEDQYGYTATDASQLSYQATVPGTTMPVFINGSVYEVPSTGVLDVAGTFGSDVILVHSSGEILPVNERGVLMKSLQMGECYYLVFRSI